MSNEQRLNNSHTALKQKGVTDVKFFFRTSTETPLSQVVDDSALLLEAVLAGKFKPMEPIGDRKPKQ